MINTRWLDIKKLKRDRNTVIKLVENEGIIIDYDDAERERAKRFFLPLLKVFQSEIFSSSLALLYVYRQSSQPGHFVKCDGQCNIFENGKRLISAIGLSIELLHAPEDYSVMVAIHEITHLRHAQHDSGFYDYMDMLLKKYNDHYDKHIKNDYQGLGEKMS